MSLVRAVLVFISGALVGAFVTMITIYWQLATGRRTVRPLKDL